MTSRIAFILPAYKETVSIYKMIVELCHSVPRDSYILIVDDSPDDSTSRYCEDAFRDANWDPENTAVIRNNRKQGRGAAVQVGLNHAFLIESISCFVEMDSDGSHSAEMALAVANEIGKADFCIGSRYLSNSQILGWSLQRRTFSKFINTALRWIFGKGISDWTNGLRGYSRKATKRLCEHKALTSGFIYLSEQAVILSNGDFKVSQVPIIFRERTHGSSTVTWRELANAISGITRIMIKRRALTTK
jgi:dolichol-phosphate mannosyltransferase